MKLKPLYMHISGVVIVLLAIVFISTSCTNDKKTGANTEINKQQMPNDDVHKGKGGMNPSKDNVDKEAVKQFEMLKKEYEANPSDTLKAKAYAQMLAAGHQPQDAIKIFEDILKVDKKRVDVLLLLTMVNYNLQDFNKAEEYTNQILKIDKKHSEALYNSGAIAAAKGDKEKAKKIWEDIIRKYPNTKASKYSVMALNNLK